MSRGFEKITVQRGESGEEAQLVAQYAATEIEVYAKYSRKLEEIVTAYTPDLHDALATTLPKLSHHVVKFLAVSMMNIIRWHHEHETADKKAVSENIASVVSEFLKKVDDKDELRGMFPVIKPEGASSTLHVMVFGDNAVFINTIGSKHAEIWKRMADIVPCSPYLKSRRIFLGHTRLERIFRNMTVGSQEKVYTRYTGMGFQDVHKVFSKHGRMDIVSEIERQRGRIRHALFRNNIRHGHLHRGNQTVEFVSEAAIKTEGQNLSEMSWEKYYECARALNQLPFDKKTVLLEPHEFIRAELNGEKYIPVVRVIDMDAAKAGYRRFIPFAG